MQLSPAVHASAAPANHRPESAIEARPGRRQRARSYLSQGYAARRRPMRFRIR